MHPECLAAVDVVLVLPSEHLTEGLDVDLTHNLQSIYTQSFIDHV